MKSSLLKIVNAVFGVTWLILIAPFILPAFAIVKLTGGEPFAMDAGGTCSFVTMCGLAILFFVAALAFSIGYLL